MKSIGSIRRFCPAILFCVLLSSSSFLAASSQEENSDDSKSLDQWVALLSDVSPANREKAELELLKLGVRSLPAINRGLQNGNLETHARCKILLEKIELARKERVVQQFLNLVTEEQDFRQLKAWPAFREFLGEDDVLRRKMFLEMCDRIPLLFENYQVKSELAATDLKSTARMALVPDRHYSASADLLVMAYFFIADQARRKHLEDGAFTDLFNAVEIFEVVNFVSNRENANVIQQSDYRLIVDKVVSDWLEVESEKNGFQEEAKWNLIFQTANSILIKQLESRYESLSVSEKLKFIAIVLRSSSSNPKTESEQSLEWLSKPLADDTEVLSSRIRKRPAETVDVAVKMLAEAVAATILNLNAEASESIELEKIFGDFPLSNHGFAVLKGEKSRQMLSQRLRTRQKDDLKVE